MVAAEDREEKNLAKQMISQTSVTKLFGMSRTRCIWHNNCVANYNAPARKQTNDACLGARVQYVHSILFRVNLSKGLADLGLGSLEPIDHLPLIGNELGIACWVSRHQRQR